MKEKDANSKVALDAADVWRRMLESRAFLNEKAKIDSLNASKVEIEVPLKKPGFLVPPISWLIKPRDRKTIRLDPLGSEVLELIRHSEKVVDVVDRFAERNGLSFHESRVSVTQYISQLVDNGIVVISMPKEVA